jgi:hypothetical protein
MLVHHPDSKRASRPWCAHAASGSIHSYVTRICTLEPVGDVHQSGFARAVLAEECVNLTGLQEKVDPAQCMHGAEALLDSGKLQQGRHSEAGGVIVEIPVDVELLGEVGRHGLNAKRLSCVVSRVDHIETPLHGIEVTVVGTLTRDERV